MKKTLAFALVALFPSLGFGQTFFPAPNKAAWAKHSAVVIGRFHVKDSILTAQRDMEIAKTGHFDPAKSLRQDSILVNGTYAVRKD